jgi:hypothetical protein
MANARAPISGLSINSVSKQEKNIVFITEGVALTATAKRIHP